MSDNAPFQIKYRPRTFKEVVGQQETVKSLEKHLSQDNVQHSYLFTGPSGCGKTTFARILASHFGCLPNNIVEADAATNNGIDDMRGIIDTLRYIGFGESTKMVILDECHALSKAAWQSVLKTIEEPPPHVFFALCTTDPAKVPETIKTRCLTYHLKPVKFDDIMDLLERVADEEGLKTPDEIMALVGRQCDGSPRMALTMLTKVMECQDRDEAASLLEAPMENAEIIDLARKMLDRNLKWKEAVDILKAMPEQSPESIRIVVTTYLAGCLMNPKGEKDVPRLLNYLYAFSKPCNPTDKMAPILLALGDCIFRD